MLEANKDTFLQEDLEYIVETFDFSKFEGKSVFITGATGLVGSRLALAFLCANRIKKLNTKLYLLIRNRDKAADIYGELLDERKEINLVIGDLNNSIEVEDKIDYIIHCASVTTSKTMVEKPVETIKASVNGTLNVMDFARTKDISSMVYVSSMEMYGSFEESNLVDENTIGYINPLVVRSNYPESKRMCENMCVAYKSEYNIPVKIARLSQVFGAGVLKGENRVFAQFAKSAIKGEDIVLHTKGLSEGNYTYLADAIIALLIILTKGANGEAYNVCNEKSHTTIAGMAKMVSDELAGGAIKTVFDIPEGNVFGYASDTKMKLDASKLRALGWTAKYDLLDSYKRLIETLKLNAED